MTWAHWVLYNIPPSSTGLEEGIASSSSSSALPAGTMVGRNDWRETGYGGPSPPVGRHRYFHRLYALDAVLPDLGPAATRSTVLGAMEGHVIGRAELIGTYQKA
jgi:Raf kinase inhibitor-like YbhB/YbcL family protein